MAEPDPRPVVMASNDAAMADFQSDDVVDEDVGGISTRNAFKCKRDVTPAYHSGVIKPPSAPLKAAESNAVSSTHCGGIVS